MPDRGRAPTRFTIIAWGPERPPMTFRADDAVQAYDIALDKSVYASLQVRVTDEEGKEISLADLSGLARLEAES